MDLSLIHIYEDQFSAMLAIIVPPIIEQITKNSNVDDEKAISHFYKSKLYQELSDEKSKLWHNSPMTLYTMYQDELLTGSYDSVSYTHLYIMVSKRMMRMF